MKMLKNCCFCVSLTNGGVIVGRLALAKGIVGTLALGSILLSLVETDAVGKGARNLLDKLCNVYAILLGLFVFSVITAGMLILGAIKRRTHFVIPHLVTEGTHCAATLVYICIKTYMLIKRSDSYTPMEYSNAQDELTGGILALVVEIYLWLCVFSLYNKLQDEKHLQQNTDGGGPDPTNIPYSHIREI